MCDFSLSSWRYREALTRVTREFASFAGVGVVGTLAQYLVLIILVRVFAFDAVTGSSLGCIVGAIVNYLLNYKLTFRSTKPHTRAVPMFMTVAVVGLIINANLMYLFTSHFGLYYLIAQVITTGVVLGWNFLANRLWTFRGESNDESKPV